MRVPITARLLSRAEGDRSPAPVRILHLGLGNFFRAHQAWYTAHAPDAAEWGIAAFTGRSPATADALRPQDGLYTLITRGERDEFEVVTSVSAVHTADEQAVLLSYFASPALAIVTLTVTEAGYRRGPSGGLDATDPEVAADRAALRQGRLDDTHTVPGWLVAGLITRRAADLPPLTLVPCDNLPGNGAVLARVVYDLAVEVDPSLVRWIASHVQFATTMVDRITPATTEDDRRAVLDALGVADAAPVPTEPFSEWIIQGAFPAGHPDWEAAGARFVSDVEPFEHRKLTLLNGAHSLLAYAGGLRGHDTVADAIADPVCRSWVEQWWDEACTQLPLPSAELESYRASLLARFRNPKIRHNLAQIAVDGSLKLPVRIVPTLSAELATGRVPEGSCRAIAAWVLHLRGRGTPVSDVNSARMDALVNGSLGSAVAAVLDYLQLSGGPALSALIERLIGELAARD